VVTGAVVLAAGGSSRFGGSQHKLLSTFRGRPLILWALEHAQEAEVGPTAVVTGAVDLKPLVPAGIECIENPAWADGQATSLQAAVAWARQRTLEAVVVGLGDQPLVPPEAWRAVAAVGSPIGVATFEGRRCPPTKLAAAVWPLLPTTGDVGARAVIARHPDLVEAVACPGQAIDIDTLEDLARWS
jgi:molybdenum cofactor cytidylyltransferase